MRYTKQKKRVRQYQKNRLTKLKPKLPVSEMWGPQVSSAVSNFGRKSKRKTHSKKSVTKTVNTF